jgi:GNAT superfamily N-acetyltransferase
MAVKIEINFEKDPLFEDFLQTGIKNYNNLHSPYHLKSREEGYVKTINIIVRNPADEIVGGINGTVYWNWAKIEDLYFEAPYRKLGLGHKILEDFIVQARASGANKVFLTTYSFQAKAFYEKHRFFVVGLLEDYPPGENYYTMVKKLS